MAGKIYEIHMFDGEHVFIDVDDISFMRAYEPSSKYGVVEISMKDGRVHEIKGYYEHTLPKKVKDIYQDIVDLRNNKLNNNYSE